MKDESGTIAAGGKCFDYISATVIDYIPYGENNSTNKKETHKQITTHKKTTIPHKLHK